MRPPGEIRRLALGVLGEFVAARRRAAAPGAHWREVAAQLRPLKVTPQATRNTLKNMARAGVIEPVGEVRVAGSPKPLALYAPVQRAGGHSPQSVLTLTALTRSWVASSRGGG